jgi:hypothetical protein
MVRSREKPVDELAVAMVELRRPVSRTLPGLALEKTERAGVLELDEVVDLSDRIPGDKVAEKVAEQILLEGNPVEAINGRVIRAEEGGQVDRTLEEGE